MMQCKGIVLRPGREQKQLVQNSEHSSKSMIQFELKTRKVWLACVRTQVHDETMV